MAVAIPAKGYTVYDEMGCEVLMNTTDRKEAEDCAYNHQCVLFYDGKVLHDYSCDY